MKLIILSLSLPFFFFVQQFDRANKLRNLGQRPRNMLAKAGEGDRAIKTKMVSFCPSS